MQPWLRVSHGLLLAAGHLQEPCLSQFGARSLMQTAVQIITTVISVILIRLPHFSVWRHGLQKSLNLSRVSGWDGMQPKVPTFSTSDLRKDVQHMSYLAG